MSNDANHTLGIFYDGGSYPVLEAWSQGQAGPLKSAIRKLAALANYQRNPRPRQYMESLLRAKWPGKFDIVEIGTDRTVPSMNWTDYSKIVLLWPDSNGLGWRNIERQVRRSRHSSIVVLTGRNRSFDFGGSIYRKLRMRRTLEKSQLDKVVFSFALMVVAPCFWMVDLLRGKR